MDSMVCKYCGAVVEFAVAEGYGRCKFCGSVNRPDKSEKKDAEDAKACSGTDTSSAHHSSSQPDNVGKIPPNGTATVTTPSTSSSTISSSTETKTVSYMATGAVPHGSTQPPPRPQTATSTPKPNFTAKKKPFKTLLIGCCIVFCFLLLGLHGIVSRSIDSIETSGPYLVADSAKRVNLIPSNSKVLVEGVIHEVTCSDFTAFSSTTPTYTVLFLLEDTKGNPWEIKYCIDPSIECTFDPAEAATITGIPVQILGADFSKSESPPYRLNLLYLRLLDSGEIIPYELETLFPERSPENLMTFYLDKNTLSLYHGDQYNIEVLPLEQQDHHKVVLTFHNTSTTKEPFTEERWCGYRACNFIEGVRKYYAEETASIALYEFRFIGSDGELTFTSSFDTGQEEIGLALVDTEGNQLPYRTQSELRDLCFGNQD